MLSTNVFNIFRAFSCCLFSSLSFAVQPDNLKCCIVCGTVYEDIHNKDFLGSIARVGYRIPIQDFCLVLHSLEC